MFVSRKEVESRLASTDNLLREEVIPVDANVEVTKEGVVETRIEVEEVIKTPTIDALDALIRGDRAPRAKSIAKAEVRDALAEVKGYLGEEHAHAALGLRSRSDVRDAQGVRQPILAERSERTIEQKILHKKSRVALTAAHRLGLIVKNITPEKIEQVESPLELAQLGKNVAAIVQATSPKEQVDEGGVHFHIYKPEIQSIDAYSIIQINQQKIDIQGQTS